MGHYSDEHPHAHPHPPVPAPARSAPPAQDLTQARALLEYMLRHNEQHAEELAYLLEMLPEQPRKKLLRAIGTFEAANTELQTVLDCLNE